MQFETIATVRDGMSTEFLTVGAGHTLREAARLMAERNVGAAVVLDPDGHGPGIITERDLMRSIAAGQSPNEEFVATHVTEAAIVAEGHWPLPQAAQTMINGGFRHLVVIGADGLPTGMLSIRDIVRCWLTTGAITPQGVQAGQASSA